MVLFPLLGTAAAQSPVHNTDERPVVILVEGGLGSPIGMLGARVGYKQWEIGGGIGATGYQLSGQWKYYWKPFDSEIVSFPVGVGPSVGLSGEDYAGGGGGPPPPRAPAMSGISWAGFQLSKP